MTKKVDVAVNVFAKPYQTSLSLLTLLNHSKQMIDKIYVQLDDENPFEAKKIYSITDYLARNAILFTPKYFLRETIPDVSSLYDKEYRNSVRYQYAFEHTDKQYLFIIHNDIIVKRDVINVMLDAIGDAIAVGRVGQCWNCPACHQDVLTTAGIDAPACTPALYANFRPDGKQLRDIYAYAEKLGKHLRRYNDYLAEDKAYCLDGYPLPECRVNEWCCLVNVEQSNRLTIPKGEVLPFGAFSSVGKWLLDTSVAWFREVTRRGSFAKHIDINKYIIHSVGRDKQVGNAYRDAEYSARIKLEKYFPDFVLWCKKNNTGWFD
jgi:hypothetical protein